MLGKWLLIKCLILRHIQTLTRLVVPYTENFRGRKLLQISRFCGYLESFPHEIWGRGVMWRATSEQPAKVFSAKIAFFTNLWKFSPSKFSHHTVKTTAFYKLCTAARFPHRLPYIHMSRNVHVDPMHPPWFHQQDISCLSLIHSPWNVIEYV